MGKMIVLEYPEAVRCEVCHLVEIPSSVPGLTCPLCMLADEFYNLYPLESWLIYHDVPGVIGDAARLTLEEEFAVSVEDFKRYFGRYVADGDGKSYFDAERYTEIRKEYTPPPPSLPLQLAY